ncbi:MAG: Transposase IS200 like protein [Chloroflexi bacterium ADurb.Bin360]|nr:MAG: Transposase IS200 like protein [Chloroflexi bacterium ADurb.Bin360]
MPPRPAYTRDHSYHFYNRGAHRVSIFREPENYLFVLRKLKHYCAELSLMPLAYCLLPNHYHFFIRQDGEQPAGMLPQLIFNSYTKAYNKRYEHSGTLFESEYKVVEVKTEAHLLTLCRYIHCNPVKHGLVETLDEWPYSNYLEWTEERPGTLVDRDFIRLYYPTGQAYREEIQAYLREWKREAALEYLEAFEVGCTF